LKVEEICISKKTKKSQSVCRKYRVKEICRKRSYQKAANWAAKCKAQVVLLDAEKDEAPADCELCGEGANRVLEQCVAGGNGGFKNRCKAWIFGQRQVECYEEKYKHFSTLCGKRNLQTYELNQGQKPDGCVEEAPEACATAGKARIQKLFDDCSHEADSIANECKAFEHRVGCWSEKHKKAAFWSRFCKVDIVYPQPHFRPPPKCYHDESQSEQEDGESHDHSFHGHSEYNDEDKDGIHHSWFHHSYDNWFNFIHQNGEHDTPITCQEKANERINSKNALCMQAADFETDECRRLNHEKHCEELNAKRIERWNKKCGIHIPIPPPKLGLPMKCASNTGVSCAKKSSKENLDKIKDCLDGAKKLKLNTCGLLHARNHCYLEGVERQLAKSKACNWNWIDIIVKLEINSDCPMEKCLDTGKTMIKHINDVCVEASKDQKESAGHARRVNSCLQDYDFVPKFFNGTCREKILLNFNFEDESKVCALPKKDEPEPAVVPVETKAAPVPEIPAAPPAPAPVAPAVEAAAEKAVDAAPAAVDPAKVQEQAEHKGEAAPTDATDPNAPAPAPAAQH
jgi:hypothetical protein